MTAVRIKGKFVKLTPKLVAPIATQNHKLEAQREKVAERMERAERVSPSRTRASQARARGYRGPLTRAELAKGVQG
jgi:hypothetical protein